MPLALNGPIHFALPTGDSGKGQQTQRVRNQHGLELFCFFPPGGPLLWWHVNKLYVVGVLSASERIIVDNVKYACYPGTDHKYTQLYPFRDWLSGFIGRNKCIG